MAEGISLLDLPQLNVAQVEDGQFVYLVTPEGDPYKVAIEDLFTATNANVGNSNFIFHTEDFTSAQVLAAVTASPVALTLPRTAGDTIFIQSAYCGMAGTLTTPYNTNVTVAVRYVGADVPIFTCQVLDRTVAGNVPMTINTTATVGQTVVIADADLEWYVVGGAALAGTGNLVFNLTYTPIA